MCFLSLRQFWGPGPRPWIFQKQNIAPQSISFTNESTFVIINRPIYLNMFLVFWVFRFGVTSESLKEADKTHGRKYNMCQEQKIQYGSGRPTSCGPLVFPAFASACTFCFCPILYFLRLAHIVFLGRLGPEIPVFSAFRWLVCEQSCEPGAEHIWKDGLQTSCQSVAS